MRRLVFALLFLAACAPTPRAGAPVTVAARDAANATLARDARSGSAYIAWVHSDGQRADVYLARSDDGEHWGPATRVNDVPGDAAAHEQAPPQVVVDPRGAVLVAWQTTFPVPGRRFVASNLRFARSADGGRTFTPAVFVNDDAGGPPSSHTFHDIAVAEDGTILVSWIDSRRRDSARAARQDADEHAHHGSEDDLPGPEVRVARSRDGGASFAPAVVVANTTCPCCRTALAVGANGRVHVAFRLVGADGTRDVHVASSHDGGASFAAPVRVHADRWRVDGCPHAGPGLALSADGRLHVAWYTGAGERPGLYYSSSVDGEHFDEPAPLLTAGHMPPAHVRVSADERGAWLAWDDRRAPERRITVARAERGRVGPTLEIPVSGSTPAIAPAARGALLAWQDSGTVRVARLDPG